MSEAMKPTRGKWTVQPYIYYACQLERAEYPIHAPKRGRIARAFKESDARLIAEAGTVFNETGFTPRQLVERVKELEGAAKVALEWFDAGASHSQADFYKRLDLCADAEKFLRAALSKSLPNTVAETPT